MGSHLRPTPQVLLGESVVARGGARFFQTLETFKEHTLAYAFLAVIDMLPIRKTNSIVKAAELPRRGAKASSTDQLCLAPSMKIIRISVSRPRGVHRTMRHNPRGTITLDERGRRLPKARQIASDCQVTGPVRIDA